VMFTTRQFCALKFISFIFLKRATNLNSFKQGRSRCLSIVFQDVARQLLTTSVLAKTLALVVHINSVDSKPFDASLCTLHMEGILVQL